MRLAKRLAFLCFDFFLGAVSYTHLFELLAALDTFGVRLRVCHKAVHELILARDAHPGQHLSLIHI